MKQVISLFIAFTLGTCPLIGQSSLNEKDVIGTWTLVIPDLDQTLEEFEQKSSDKDKAEMDADDRLGHAIEGAVNEFVDDLLGDMDIKFTFEKKHRAQLEVKIMGELEIEYLSWHINSDGNLVLEDDDDDDSPEVWMKKGDKLVKVNSGDKKNNDAYMIRVSE